MTPYLMSPSAVNGLTQHQRAGWHKVRSRFDIIPLIVTACNRCQQSKVGPRRLLYSIHLERFVDGNFLARLYIQVVAKIAPQQCNVLLGGIVRTQRAVDFPRTLGIEGEEDGTRRPMVQPMDWKNLARQLPLEEGGQHKGPSRRSLGPVDGKAGRFVHTHVVVLVMQDWYPRSLHLAIAPFAGRHNTTCTTGTITIGSTETPR
mmetsp:Transcript_22554/g.64889  ORF Transcript_22554/g.64889 Transcript_22554/m.64889 type:complete len:203 (-) Transcript_22554:207-815(-)